MKHLLTFNVCKRNKPQFCSILHFFHPSVLKTKHSIIFNIWKSNKLQSSYILQFCHPSEWIASIKNTLQELELENIWNDITADSNPDILKQPFDEKSHYCEKWKVEIEKSSTCEQYSLFKTKFRIKPYLVLLQPKYSIPISRLRANNHRLPVVAGRYSGRPRSERLCNLCNLDDLGDEYHYLMKCPFFHTHRITFLKDEHIQLCNMLDMTRYTVPAVALHLRLPIVSYKNVKHVWQVNFHIHCVNVVIQRACIQIMASSDRKQWKNSWLDNY